MKDMKNKERLQIKYIEGLERLEQILSQEQERANKENNNELENYIYNLLEQVVDTSINAKIEYYE